MWGISSGYQSAKEPHHSTSKWRLPVSNLLRTKIAPDDVPYRPLNLDRLLYEQCCTRTKNGGRAQWISFFVSQQFPAPMQHPLLRLEKRKPTYEQQNLDLWDVVKTRSSEFYGTLMVALRTNILLPVRHIVHVFPVNLESSESKARIGRVHTEDILCVCVWVCVCVWSMKSCMCV